jgi:diguanylate cyclase (GGDEF)-like protein/PAS domain S-box-containing protein
MKIYPNQFENTAKPLCNADAINIKTEIAPHNEVQLILQELSLHQIELESPNQELRTEEQLESMITAVPGAIYQWVRSTTGVWNLLFLSKGIEELYEVKTDEALRDFNLLVHWIIEEDQTAYQQAIECLTINSNTWSHEYRIKTPGGKIKWIKSQASSIQQADGSLLCNGILTDITDTKVAEEELILTIRRKDQILAMLAHELRNPLGPIRNAAQLLKMQNFTDPTLEQSCNVIDCQVTHMTQLLDDLLNVALINQVKTKLVIDHLELTDIVTQAVETSRSLIKSRNQELIISQAKSPLWIEGDRVRLQQVLSVLLNNASKYSSDGATIFLSFMQKGSDAVIEVRDTGIGIAPYILPQIFDFFTQADHSLVHTQDEQGIGLTQVRALIQKQGGTITAASDGIDQGSSFTIRLPAFPMASSVTEVEPTESSSQTKKYRILIVDDYINATESLSMLLQIEGHEIETANCGLKAIELARIFHPQVVLLDIGLPDLDGYEVAKRLRALPETRNTLLIALTGYGGSEVPELTQAAGFNHYLLKPLNYKQLTILLGSTQEERTNETSTSRLMTENIPGTGKKQTINHIDLHQKKLSLFCNSHADDVALIRSAYHAGDITTAVQLGHRLSDSASSMAFTELSALAMDLNQALKQGNDILLEALLETTDSILIKLTSETNEFIFQPEEILTLQQLRIELSRLLENNVFINDDLLKQLKLLLPPGQHTELNALSQHIFDTDYVKAKSILDSLVAVTIEKTEAIAQNHLPIILVVDDERINQKLLISLLSQDYHVKVAGNGPRALDIIQTYPHPDLVMLDINMPGMDGYEVCQRMQDNPLTRNIPVIFVTGASDLKSELHGLQLGAVDFITKPINPAITLLRVRNLMLLKQHEKQLKYLAHYDALTNIPNRVLLADRMKQAIAQAKREQKILAVCYMDLDGFKQINDTLGHKAGDEVLIEITLRIGKILREGDTVARLGGDEFVVLLPNLHNVEQCIETLKRLHENISPPIVIQNQSCFVTASIGVSVFPKDNDDMDALLRLADQAMYVAKQSGKNCYHLYDQSA